MNKRWLSVALLLLGLVSLSTRALAEWSPVKLDPVHSLIGFTASTLLFDVEGRFDRYELRVDGDPRALAQAKVMLVIDAASIDTHNKRRDEHLSSEDFFDVKKYPTITFVSDSIKDSGRTLQVSGTLDMHGVKKKITIPFKKAHGKNGAGVETTSFRGKLTLNRNDYGIGAGSVAAKISLEDEVTLDLLVVAFL